MARRTRLVILLRRKTALAMSVIMALTSGVFFCARATILSVQWGGALKGRTVVIDPGHGGIDGGTGSDGLLEKDINLGIALKLRDLLRLKGCSAVLTRDSDVSLEHLGPDIKSRHSRDLSARTMIARCAGADAFVSIHMNYASDPKLKGPIAFYRKGCDECRDLAAKVLDEVRLVAGKSQEGCIGRSFHVLDKVDMPAVLLEVGFMSNPFDLSHLRTTDYQAEIAEAIAKGLDGFFASRNPNAGKEPLKQLFPGYEMLD